MTSIDPATLSTDYDRAWLQFEKASALKELNRKPEALAAYTKLLNMPRTEVMDRRARMKMYELGDETQQGKCATGMRLRSAGQIAYPALANERGIEGWSRTLADIRPDGSVVRLIVESSSLSVFEKPVADVLTGGQVMTRESQIPGRHCSLLVYIHFKRDDEKPGFAIGEIQRDDEFTFRSVGIAIRMRGELRDKALAALKAQGSAAR